jgi:predicted GNAT family acetyltransferase
MRVRCYGRDELASFVAVAWPLLAADPLRHTDSLTVLHALFAARADPGRTAEVATLLTVHERGAVRGALVRTPGRPALVSAVRPEHAGSVDDALATADPGLPGVTGPADAAEALAAAYQARTGLPVRVDMRMRLFALDVLTPVDGVAGAVRPAAAADVELLAGWLLDFRREATPQLRDPHPPVERVRRRLAAGDGLLFWELDGVPVALAQVGRPIAGMSRIGPVYTRPGHRRRGFGAAVTAAAARWARRAGAERVALFVDRANPTTNRLYPRLGFRPVHDVVELSFAPG